jgi:hypothetical protein
MKTQKCRHLRVGNEYDITAVSTISAIWPSKWFEFFAPNRDTPVTAITRTEMEGDVINESRHVSSSSCGRHMAIRSEKQKRGGEPFQLAPSTDGVPALLRRDDVDDLAATLRAKLHSASCQREQGVIAATTDIDAGVEVGATLADKNFAR